MTTPQQMVTDFHRAFGLAVRDHPTIDVEPWEVELRHRLIDEERAELRQAMDTRDLESIAHELADLAYVVIGTSLHYGIDLDRAIAAIHVANMSKLGEDGRPIYRADGKVMRGPNYQPPNMAAVLRPAAGAVS